MDILFIIKVEILVLMKWSYRAPQLCCPIEPKTRMVVIYKDVV